MIQKNSFNGFRLKKISFFKSHSFTTLHSMLHSDKSFFLFSWFSLYLLCVTTTVFTNFLFTGQVLFPHALIVFVNSFWGGFAVVSLFIALLLHYYYPSSLRFSELFQIDSNSISITNTDFQIAVFTCKPPVLHNKNDFIFFLKNFQPLSIELDCKNQIIYFLLFGQSSEDFKTKINDCRNQLHSMFSTVVLAQNNDLEKFLLSGYLSYRLDNLVPKKNFFPTLSFWKNLKSNEETNTHQDPICEIDKTNFKDSLNRNPDKNVFLLMLLGTKGFNSILGSSLDHFFRGVRLGEVTTPQKRNLTMRDRFSIKELEQVVLSCLRLPEKHSYNSDISNLDRNYFFKVKQIIIS